MSLIVRTLAFISGAIWFLPISCTTGLIVGVPLVSQFHERHMEKGDKPHSLFYVVWQPGEEGRPFGFSKLDGLARINAPDTARAFIMTQPSGRIEGANPPWSLTKSRCRAHRNNSSSSRGPTTPTAA